MTWPPARPRSLFHGTLHHHATALQSGPVNLNLCRPDSDFGRGFYLTSNLSQACQWANTRVLPWQGPNQKKIAAVLEFEVDWNQLATRSDLALVWEGAAPASDYWLLVAHCRGGGLNRGTDQQAQYDVVYGPVSLWPQYLVIKDCDQVSFHTDRAIAILTARTIVRSGSIADPFVR